SNSRRPIVTVIRPSRARCVKKRYHVRSVQSCRFKEAGCWLLSSGCGSKAERLSFSLCPRKRTIKLAQSSPRSWIAPRESQSVRTVPNVNQGIIGFLDPIGQLSWQENQLLLRFSTVGHYFVDRQNAQLRDFAVVRPSYGRVLGGIARRCKLRLQVKRYWAVLEALRQFVHQEIRRLFRRIRCGEMH